MALEETNKKHVDSFLSFTNVHTLGSVDFTLLVFFYIRTIHNEGFSRFL